MLIIKSQANRILQITLTKKCPTLEDLKADSECLILSEGSHHWNERTDQSHFTHNHYNNHLASQCLQLEPRFPGTYTNFSSRTRPLASLEILIFYPFLLCYRYFHWIIFCQYDARKIYFTLLTLQSVTVSNEVTILQSHNQLFFSFLPGFLYIPLALRPRGI